MLESPTEDNVLETFTRLSSEQVCRLATASNTGILGLLAAGHTLRSKDCISFRKLLSSSTSTSCRGQS